MGEVGEVGREVGRRERRRGIALSTDIHLPLTHTDLLAILIFALSPSFDPSAVRMTFRYSLATSQAGKGSLCLRVKEPALNAEVTVEVATIRPLADGRQLMAGTAPVLWCRLPGGGGDRVGRRRNLANNLPNVQGLAQTRDGLPYNGLVEVH